jgi:phospholipid/cholesterol/gamma-HCH transport system permease protein
MDRLLRRDRRLRRQIVRHVYDLRVFRFFGEGLRQSGILIVSSTLIIWSLMFILGLECGIEGPTSSKGPGRSGLRGSVHRLVRSARDHPPMRSATCWRRVGTGIVAGSVRWISDEIDALEVMGIDSVTFLCATRLLAAWLVLPFMYLAGIGGPSWPPTSRSSSRSRRSPPGVLPDLLAVPEPGDFLFSLIKAMFMATAIVLVACYYGYNASGGPVGVATATAKSMVLNLVFVYLIGMVGTQIFWGANPRAPIGG